MLLCHHQWRIRQLPNTVHSNHFKNSYISMGELDIIGYKLIIYYHHVSILLDEIILFGRSIIQYYLCVFFS